MRRRRSRELALKLLYWAEIGGESYPEASQGFWRYYKKSQAYRSFAEYLVEGINKNRTVIDEVIMKHTISWDITRMSTMDRNILRIAAFEILYCPEIPFKVSINEALEISKKYSNPEASPFINGILDKIALEKEKSDKLKPSGTID